MLTPPLFSWSHLDPQPHPKCRHSVYPTPHFDFAGEIFRGTSWASANVKLQRGLNSRFLGKEFEVKKYFGKKNIGQNYCGKTILGQWKFRVSKNSWSVKINGHWIFLVSKNFWLKKNFGYNNFLTINFWSRKEKNIFGQIKFLVNNFFGQTIFLVEKTFGQKIFLVETKSWPKKIVLNKFCDQNFIL